MESLADRSAPLALEDRTRSPTPPGKKTMGKRQVKKNQKADKSDSTASFSVFRQKYKQDAGVRPLGFRV